MPTMQRKITNWNQIHPEQLDDENGYGMPWWWEDKTKPCDCDCDVKCTHQAIGYSDFLYYKVECLKCKHTWCLYIEG